MSLTSQDFYQLGIDRTEEGNFTGAIKAYSQAILLQPDFKDAYKQRGLTYLSLDNISAAITDFDRTLELSPHDADNAEIYEFCAFAKLSQGNV